MSDFYPRPPRGGRPCKEAPIWQKPNFYPRPPRGGRLSSRPLMIPNNKFLSTPSARRATSERRAARTPLQISIHALREEGDRAGAQRRRPYSNFYPRPPRGGRPEYLGDLRVIKEFLSTPSARRATKQADGKTTEATISIHALREEGDEQGHGRGKAGFDFYPRPPRGGRHFLGGVLL